MLTCFSILPDLRRGLLREAHDVIKREAQPIAEQGKHQDITAPV
jgi:hypothetical protein